MTMPPLKAAAITAVPFAVSGVLGALHPPSPSNPPTFRWYRSLDKPGFTPPDWAFGAAWPVLQMGLAWGGYRLLRRPEGPARTAALGLWTFNVLMIGGWSELFFGGRKLGPAALAAGGMVATAALSAAVAAPVDRKAAATAVPFALWLTFATVLATSIWRRNP